MENPGKTPSEPSERHATPSNRHFNFPPCQDFASLTVHDLLDAREAYHVFLSNLDNVVGTGIGRYLIHKDDWYATHRPEDRRRPDFPRVEGPRTLANTVIREWSWPCVLVFVRDWDTSSHPGKSTVPRRFYLADGRIVPTCVVLAEPDETLPPSVTEIGDRVCNIMGGGYPCLRTAQGISSIGTIACLVQRGGAYYALTNRHVAGTPGDVVKAWIRGEAERIGVAADSPIGKLSMSTIFPEWPGLHSLTNIDAGLVKLDDVSRWTSQVFGIGEIGELFDAKPTTVTLDLIGLPTRAFGGASGVLEGEIKAIFFRYQSFGGTDHVADLLIGPRTVCGPGDERDAAGPSNVTLPGDSGAIWFYDPPKTSDPRPDDDVLGARPIPERGRRARRLRPIAMQWGGERIVQPDGSKSAFALATFLSTVCRNLDVDIVRSYSIGYSEYWGKIAHFAVGWKACELLPEGPLRTLMAANQGNVGFGDERLGEGSEFKVGRGNFIPLADVPDYVWIGAGMRRVRAREAEGQQHFADIDIKAIDGGPSMLDACRMDPGNLSATVWRDYFLGFEKAKVGPGEGSLPFRVWQIWTEMVAYLSRNQVDRFVAAAGILAHYVSDASMPFHTSYLHHGRLPMVKIGNLEFPVRHDSVEYEEYKKTRPAQIHAIYDEQVFEVDTVDALRRINAKIGEEMPGAAPPEITSGYEAGLAAFKLMSDSIRTLSPEDILEKDDPELGPKRRAENLWRDPGIRNAIVRSIADSTLLLARLWKSAWAMGLEKGFSPEPDSLGAFGEADIMRIYKSSDFLPALTLDQMVAAGEYEAPLEPIR